MSKPFNRTAHIEELQMIVKELESLPDSDTKESLLFERRRELRFWKAHHSLFTYKTPIYGMPVRIKTPQGGAATP